MTLDLLGRLVGQGAAPRRVSVTPEMAKGKWRTLADLKGPGVITHMWFTFPPGDVNLGRRTLLRIFWDGERDASVESPLTDFFCLPFGYTGAEYKVACEYIAVAPNNGLNCYFHMPFAKSARIEVLPEEIESGGGFYFQCDYCLMERGLPAEYRDLRFHAQWRFENPAENYGRNYLFLDAVGRGALAGASFGVEMNRPQADPWYHGGGDSIFIDGEGEPTVLHGIGAEDFFGHSWGTAEFQSRYIGVPRQETDGYGHLKRVVAYRFFGADPVPFKRSIRAVLGALANNYSSVAYWYQAEPHTPFFKVPKGDARMHGATARYGKYDIEPEDLREWKILAPFKIDASNPFSKTRAFETRVTGREEFLYEAEGRPTLPGGNVMKVRWSKVKAYHNFLDLNVVARPAIYTIRLQAGVVGYALTHIYSPRKREALIHLGFDDETSVRVNGEAAFHGVHAHGFEAARFTARLRKGRNRVLVKLSNELNTTWKLWAFSFRVED